MALRILGRLKTTVAIGPSCCTRMSALGLTVVQCSRGTQVPALAQAARGWWRWEEWSVRHGAYETPALPLSYTAGWPGRPRSERSVPHGADTQKRRKMGAAVPRTLCYNPRGQSEGAGPATQAARFGGLFNA